MLDLFLYDVSVNEVERQVQFDDALTLSPNNLVSGSQQRFTVDLIVTVHTPPYCAR